MGGKKFYVVWHGVEPGIYSSWNECKQQINGFDGAVYKSFTTKEEAETAYNSSPYIYIGKDKKAKDTTPTTKGLQDVPYDRHDTVLSLPLQVQAEALAVDAACSGNPGPMEYRAVYLRTGEQIFHYGPVHGTNNIGEFLALVHGLALLQQKQLTMPIYSDSRNAISWVKQKKCKTKLERNAQTEALFQMIERAENWLKTNTFKNPIIKWETENWGEIPADFGRK
ncbi:MAG: ribonuclease H family protein [Paraprevotella sp.]|nr:ribonuclease H family protein [Paraprevotella sp.]